MTTKPALFCLHADANGDAARCACTAVVHPVDSATRPCCGGIGAHAPDCGVGVILRLRLRLTAHHEAGHAVAVLLRGGGVLESITIEPTADYLGRTKHLTKAIAPQDAMFVTFAGPWAEARAQWPLSSLNGEDDDGCTFADYLADAWLAEEDGDLAMYKAMRSDDFATTEHSAEHLGISPDELIDIRERVWGRELEDAWGVIRQVADMLLAGEPVTDPVVRELVDRLWDE